MGEVCLLMVCRYDVCYLVLILVQCYLSLLPLQTIETAVRRLNDIGVFTVFVILDSLLKVGCVPYLY